MIVTFLPYQVTITSWLKRFCPQSTCDQNINPFVPNATLSTPPPPPENTRKPYGFLMFSGIRERLHSEQIDQVQFSKWLCSTRERFHEDLYGPNPWKQKKFRFSDAFR